MKLYKYLLVALSFSIVSAQIVFQENILDNNVGGIGSNYGIDIDNDNDLDILIAGIEDNSIIQYRNDGGSPVEWTKIIIDSNVSGARSIHANDIDGDGDIDIVGSSYSGVPSVLWWRNDGGDPTIWTRQSVSQTFQNSHEVFSIDIDKDGDCDILSASSDQHTIAIWYNDSGSPITWTRQTVGISEHLAKSVHAADIDNDGDVDLVSAAILSNVVAFWKNDGGSPISWSRNVVDNNFLGAHRVEIIDIDSDGLNDILGAGYTGNVVAWWRNDGSNPINWERQDIATQFLKACIATAIDIDNDGDRDVVATGQESNKISWWENDGSFPVNWTEHIIADDFIRPWPLFAGDVNNDGDFDIIVSSSHNGGRYIKWWDNQTTLGVKHSKIPQLKLLRNFPNPFNPTTTIELNLETSAYVTINLYNSLGRHIRNIYSGNIEKGITHINLDAHNLPSGNYVYELQTEDGSIINKCTLIK